jgi:hypothetical protein
MKDFQNVTPSRSILFAVIAQAITHNSPAIPSDSHPTATTKCIFSSIVAPKKLQTTLVCLPVA